MRISMTLLAAAFCAAAAAPALARDPAPPPGNSASPAKEADKMRSGETTGTTPNAAIPGANPAADGNATQDSRTTRTKDR